MLLIRIAVAAILAPLLAAIPYMAVAYFYADKIVPEGGPAALGALAFGALAAVGVPLGAIFLMLARLSWKQREMVVHEHLFGWPLGFAVLLLFFVGIPAAFEGVAALIAVVSICIVCAAMGVGAMKLWLWLSYPNQSGAGQDNN